MNQQAGKIRKAARFVRAALLFLFSMTLLSSCSSLSQIELPFGEEKNASIHVRITALDGSWEADLPLNISVRQALETMRVPYSEDDRIEPDLSSQLTANTQISIVRITFEENTSEKIIPFESQTVRNETLPDGETYIIQAGQNGREQIVTRSTFENGILISQNTSKRTILQEAVPEILMLGAKAEYAPIRISGKLVYISNGSAWLMTESTENRVPLVTSGDLDGHILDLSSDGNWLLFSRKTRDDEINSLWMLNISDWSAKPISLRVSNVIHFAAWLPGEARRILYSTVNPSAEAPGWKANNDLWMQIVSDTGMLMSREELTPADNSGTYSWWGTEFELSADSRSILYASAGSIGIIDRLTGEKHPLLNILPYEKTRSDWAWIPGLTWNDDGSRFFFSYHGDISGTEETFDPSDYHLGSYLISEEQAQPFIQKSGIFSYPRCSPRFSDGSLWLAYLQTLAPMQSEAERYRIMLASEDGTEIRPVYPLEGAAGFVSPQKLVWAPVSERSSTWISFLQQGNLWLVNPFSGIYNQITVDGSITKFIWE